MKTFTFINLKTLEVETVDINCVKYVRIYHGDKDFIIYLKDETTVIKGKRYNRNSPLKTFLNHAKENNGVVFNELDTTIFKNSRKVRFIRWGTKTYYTQ